MERVQRKKKGQPPKTQWEGCGQSAELPTARRWLPFQAEASESKARLLPFEEMKESLDSSEFLSGDCRKMKFKSEVLGRDESRLSGTL